MMLCAISFVLSGLPTKGYALGQPGCTAFEFVKMLPITAFFFAAAVVTIMPRTRLPFTTHDDPTNVHDKFTPPVTLISPHTKLPVTTERDDTPSMCARFVYAQPCSGSTESGPSPHFDYHQRRERPDHCRTARGDGGKPRCDEPAADGVKRGTDTT